MEKFDIMINEESHTLINVEADNLEEAKTLAILKYLNKDLLDHLDKNTSFSVTVAERHNCGCTGR